MNLDDLILNGIESVNLDFKKELYSRFKKSELLKDVMSMANARVTGPRFIIFGVEESKGVKSFEGVNASEIMDAASYQQFVSQYINPTIEFAVLCHAINGITYAIIRIEPGENAPYMMKKEFSDIQQYPTKKPIRLEVGEAWIRVGTHKRRMELADFEGIYTERYANQRFSGDVRVVFSDTGTADITIQAPGKRVFPSDIAREKIEEKIAQSRKDELRKDESLPEVKRTQPSNIGSIVDPKRMEQIAKIIEVLNRHPKLYSTEYWEKELEKVDSEYLEDDCYYFYEELGHKIDLTLDNRGNRFLDRVRIVLEIPKDGIVVADKIYEKPDRSVPTYQTSILKLAFPREQYPSVTEEKANYVVTVDFDEVRHNIPIEVFDAPLPIGNR